MNHFGHRISLTEQLEDMIILNPVISFQNVGGQIHFHLMEALLTSEILMDVFFYRDHALGYHDHKFYY